MKIILDNDATVTDYYRFIDRVAIPYFKRKYRMQVIQPNELELTDIFDMKHFFKMNTDGAEEEKERAALDRFWISYRFILFSLFGKLQPGAAKALRKLIKQGHSLEIHTSRSKTCEQTCIGVIARAFTMMQYWLHGIWLRPGRFVFYDSDIRKIAGIEKAMPQVVFEDKPAIVRKLADDGLAVVCVRGRHNEKITSEKNVECLSRFDHEQITACFEKLLGKKQSLYWNRESLSVRFYHHLFAVCPFINACFRPLVLHVRNLVIPENEGVIYAPNHRSTIDPIVITAVLKKPIHWVALKRFFDEEDSIFNNSKNKLLCKLTAKAFRKLEFFPIERKWDNPEPDNMNSIKDMHGFLKIGSLEGIFPEGTTRRAEGMDFGTFDSGFIKLAQKTGAYIQPVGILWFCDIHNRKRMIINFRPAIKAKGRKADEIMMQYQKSQQSMFEENKRLVKRKRGKVIR